MARKQKELYPLQVGQDMQVYVVWRCAVWDVCVIAEGFGSGFCNCTQTRSEYFAVAGLCLACCEDEWRGKENIVGNKKVINDIL